MAANAGLKLVNKMANTGKFRIILRTFLTYQDNAEHEFQSGAGWYPAADC
jgi:hypothetical protein